MLCRCLSYKRTIDSQSPELCEGRISRLRSGLQNTARNNESANAAAEEASDSHSSQPTHTHTNTEEEQLAQTDADSLPCDSMLNCVCILQVQQGTAAFTLQVVM